MDDETLHTLLARGRLSGAQRERILDRVLEQHAPPQRRFRRWAVMAAVALPAAAAVVLALGLREGTVGPDANREWLVPKGSTPGVQLEARCPERAPGTCRHGDRLIFSADGVKRDAFLAAFAVCGSGERIWYFPSADGTMPSIRAGAGHVVADHAARIGVEHGTGRCELSLSLLERRAERATILAGSAALSGKATISFEVMP
jgi:hypothetical protein